MLVEYDVVKFCSIECRLQMSGELSVGWMVDGFLYAQQMFASGTLMYDKAKLPNVTDVLNLGKLIEPNDNALGFRTCGVRIGSDVKMDWQLVPSQMVNLMEAVRDGAFEPRSLEPGISSSRWDGANEFAKEYLEIHPWRDGNGRTAQILFNWLMGTLYNPTWHNNFWADPRRTIGFGA